MASRERAPLRRLSLPRGGRKRSVTRARRPSRSGVAAAEYTARADASNSLRLRRRLGSRETPAFAANYGPGVRRGGWRGWVVFN